MCKSSKDPENHAFREIFMVILENVYKSEEKIFSVIIGLGPPMRLIVKRVANKENINIKDRHG